MNDNELGSRYGHFKMISWVSFGKFAKAAMGDLQEVL
jgi:hypothetical protein